MSKIILTFATETITTNAMRTKTQLKHYLLSFADTLLYEWYNAMMVDPYGDYSEQGIHVNCDTNVDFIKAVYNIEKLCETMRNKNTQVSEDDNYIAICGGDKPYIITFNSFEEFLNKLSEEDRDGLLEYVQSEPTYLEELENMNKEREEK